MAADASAALATTVAVTTSSPLLRDAGVHELVPLRSHVCLPGDVVLRLEPHAVVAIGSGLHAVTTTTTNADEQRRDAAAAAVVLLTAEYCAPLQRQPHATHTHMPHYTLESPASRRYVYARGDPVVAVVLRSVGQMYYQCYTTAATPALLDTIAFDGATKTSRPRLCEGDVVYAHVRARPHGNLLDRNATTTAASSSSSLLGLYAGSDTHTGGDVELSCCAGEVGLTPKDWTSSEAVFGVLRGGRVLHVPLSYARSLLAPLSPQLLASLASSSSSLSTTRRAAQAGGKRRRDADTTTTTSTRTQEQQQQQQQPQASRSDAAPASYLLALLGQYASFDVCVGVNGLVWVRGSGAGRHRRRHRRRHCHDAAERDDGETAAAVRCTIAVCACLIEGQADATCDEMHARVLRYFAPA